MKTAPKSLNKRQCLQAFERGDWKSHDFNEISTFYSKIILFTEKSTFWVKVHFCAKSEKVSKFRTFGSILPWGGSQNALFRKMTSQTPPKPLVLLVLAPRGRKVQKDDFSAPGNILAKHRVHFPPFCEKCAPRRKGPKWIRLFCTAVVKSDVSKMQFSWKFSEFYEN